MSWNYQRMEQFDEIPVGTYRVRIADAEKGVSQSGRDMLKMTLDVSGYRSQIRHYVVFLDDRPEVTNRNLTSIFDCFSIPEGDFNLKNWVGKSGVAATKQDDFGAKINYFVSASRADRMNLPPWEEPDTSGRVAIAAAPKIDDDDLPF